MSTRRRSTAMPAVRVDRLRAPCSGRAASHRYGTTAMGEACLLLVERGIGWTVRGTRRRSVRKDGTPAALQRAVEGALDTFRGCPAPVPESARTCGR